MGVEYGKMHPTCQGQTKPWKERNSMENAQIVEEKVKKTPIGMFGVVLPPKALDTIASRKLSLYIEQRLNWVEDGLMKLIDLALSDSCKLSDYLRLVYPTTYRLRSARTTPVASASRSSFAFATCSGALRS